MLNKIAPFLARRLYILFDIPYTEFTCSAILVTFQGLKSNWLNCACVTQDSLPENFGISGEAGVHFHFTTFKNDPFVFLIGFSTSTAAVQFQIVHFKKSACLINVDLISFEVLRI